MTDQNTSGATPDNADGVTQGETDNSFAGGVGSDLPGGEQPENLQTRSDEAATQAGPDATSADDAGTDRAREKEATIGSVVESLIPVLDDIELARQHGDLTEGPMSKIADKIESTLNRFGVARFGEVDEAFDPSVHEALMHVEAEAPEGVDGTFVVQVLQPGYKVGERVVRPARVSVAG